MSTDNSFYTAVSAETPRTVYSGEGPYWTPKIPSWKLCTITSQRYWQLQIPGQQHRIRVRRSLQTPGQQKSVTALLVPLNRARTLSKNAAAPQGYVTVQSPQLPLHDLARTHGLYGFY
jgi:hypothetical protein